MNSCHLNQYFNSKPNHSPLDKILQCHFLLLDLWLVVDYDIVFTRCIACDEFRINSK